ncbi:hypothetical protein [Pseudomonas canadensis]|uniref:hypothetical protein n=1 Tax=Pseudomonas TaxID=286 RepID=UPI003BA0B11D
MHANTGNAHLNGLNCSSRTVGHLKIAPLRRNLEIGAFTRFGVSNDWLIGLSAEGSANSENIHRLAPRRNMPGANPAFRRGVLKLVDHRVARIGAEHGGDILDKCLRRRAEQAHEEDEYATRSQGTSGYGN